MGVIQVCGQRTAESNLVALEVRNNDVCDVVPHGLLSCPVGLRLRNDEEKVGVHCFVVSRGSWFGEGSVRAMAAIDSLKWESLASRQDADDQREGMLFFFDDDLHLYLAGL